MDNHLFGNLSPNEMVVLVSVFAISVGNSLSNEELLILSNFMVSSGVALLLLVNQRALLEMPEVAVTPDLQIQIQDLRKDLQQLKEILNSQS